MEPPAERRRNASHSAADPALGGLNRGKVVLEIIALDQAHVPWLNMANVRGHVGSGHGAAFPRAAVRIAAVDQAGIEEYRSARLELDRDLAAQIKLILLEKPPLDRVLMVSQVRAVRSWND